MEQLSVTDELLIVLWLLSLVIVMSVTKHWFGLVDTNLVSVSLALKRL